MLLQLHRLRGTVDITLYALVFNNVCVPNSVASNAELSQLLVYQEKIKAICGFRTLMCLTDLLLLTRNMRTACGGCLRVRSFLDKHYITKLSQIEQPAGGGGGRARYWQG
jgi:hypothetical protein